jgi:hypothetical protein
VIIGGNRAEHGQIKVGMHIDAARHDQHTRGIHHLDIFETGIVLADCGDFFTFDQGYRPEMYPPR